MKPTFLALALLSLTAPTLHATEVMFAEGGQETFIKYVNSDYVPGGAPETQKDMKISALNKLLDQQQKMYDEKITYLEDELKKTKERLIEKSLNHDKMQAYMEARFAEESSYFKKELVAKTKTLMEYQRQLEKVKPSEEMKELIKANTQMAIDLRNSADQLAVAQIQINNGLHKDIKTEVGGRQPASVGK